MEKVKVKVKRGEEIIEVEESEIQDGDERIPTEDKKGISFTDEQQKHINKLLADERRKAQQKFDVLKGEFDELKSSVVESERLAEEKNKTIVEGLKKDLPKPVLTLLGKLTISEQLEFLQNKENLIVVDEKKRIPFTPNSNEGEKPKKDIFGNLV